MSDPVRIALVAEGPTDRIVVESAMRAMLGDRAFVLTRLPPEGSLAFDRFGGGWGGVCKWCRQSAARGDGRLANDGLVFQAYDCLVLHLDADVAADTYDSISSARAPHEGALPCDRPCPPPSDTTNALRSVLLSWCGETSTPTRTVLCTPSRSTEAWVLAALFPEDKAMKNQIECFPGPEARLGQQPKGHRIRKCKKDYEAHAEAFQAAWQDVTHLSEAARFQEDFLQAVPPLDA